MSNATEAMALYKRRKCYAKSKYKACYKKKYGKEPSKEILAKWENRYRRKKIQIKQQYGLDTFGGRLSVLLAEFGMSHDELANILYRSQSAVDKWCSGRSYPNFNDLITISDMFDVSIDYLVKGE